MQLLFTKHTLGSLQKRADELNNRLARTQVEVENELNSKRSDFERQISDLKEELSILENASKIAVYNFSDYDNLSSEQCKNELSLLKVKEQEMNKDNSSVKLSVRVTKTVKDNIKQILRCFNAECDNVILNVSAKNIDISRNKIQKSFESLNKIFSVDEIELSPNLLSLKLEQLNLIYTYELKKSQEQAEQKAIREQMVEEERVRKEIEREKLKIEKETSQFKNEVHKLMQYLQNTESEAEKQLYVDKIKELEEKLALLEKDKQNVLNREQNTRAGYVYVISNIGSFGEDVYKIGMTRRLEPMDRINELSSASVPFSFDVHAMIFSDDAPALENTLHNYFSKYQVNKVNPKKEFFRVTLSEIEKVVKENHNATVTFTMLAPAKEYRDSIKLIAS